MEAWRSGHGDERAIRAMEGASQGLMRQLADLLELSDDYSLHASMGRLARAKELGGLAPRLNPHSEQTLKGNSENNYCRAHQYELVRYVYQAELEEYWKWVDARLRASEKKPWVRPASFSESRKTIQDRFYATALVDMAPSRGGSAERLRDTLDQCRVLVEALLGDRP